MNIKTLTIIATMAFAGPALAQESNADMMRLMVAAGVIVASHDVCDLTLRNPEILSFAQSMRALARTRRDLWDFYDFGVATVTVKALEDRDGYCAEVAEAWD